jgi:DNA mismatch endonuclease (patch repair protein)
MFMKIQTPKSKSMAVRNVMRANKGVNTKPELELRRLVHKGGLRYSINARPEADINRRADLVFRSAKVAVFINGCFWHGCSRHYSPPKSNKQFWVQKVKRNMERDLETKKLLSKRGWVVMVFWEHQDSITCAQKVVECVTKRRQGSK